jgi:hypothetical protein
MTVAQILTEKGHKVLKGEKMLRADNSATPLAYSWQNMKLEYDEHINSYLVSVQN